MCTQVYLAADRTLPLVPYEPEAPLHVQRVQGRNLAEQRLLRLLGRRHVYRVGSHLGCGCGFTYVGGPTRRPERQADEQAGRASVRALRDYLAEAVREGAVEVLVTPLDREDAEPTARRTVTTTHFDPDADEFVLWEGTLLTVTDNPTS